VLFLVRVTPLISRRVPFFTSSCRRVSIASRQTPIESSPLESATLRKTRSAGPNAVLKCDGVPTSSTFTWRVYGCRKWKRTLKSVTLDVCVICLQTWSKRKYICAVWKVSVDLAALHGTRRCVFQVSYLVHGLCVCQKSDGGVVLNLVISQCDLHVFCKMEEQIMPGHQESAKREERINSIFMKLQTRRLSRQLTADWRR
jgi:hypothetical protein